MLKPDIRKSIRQIIYFSSFILTISCSNKAINTNMQNETNASIEFDDELTYIKEIISNDLEPIDSITNSFGNQVILTQHGNNTKAFEVDHFGDIVWEYEFKDKENIKNPVIIRELKHSKEGYLIINKNNINHKTYISTIQIDYNGNRISNNKNNKIEIGYASDISSVLNYENGDLILGGTLNNKDTDSNDLSLIYLDKNKTFKGVDILNLPDYQLAEFFIDQKDSFLIAGNERTRFYLTEIDKSTKKEKWRAYFEGEIGEYFWLSKFFKTINNGYFFSGLIDSFNFQEIRSFAFEIFNNSLKWGSAIGANNVLIYDAVENGQGYSMIGTTNALDISKYNMLISEVDYNGNFTKNEVFPNFSSSHGISISKSNNNLNILAKSSNGLIYGKLKIGERANCYSNEIQLNYYDLKDSLVFINISSNLNKLENTTVNITKNDIIELKSKLQLRDICNNFDSIYSTSYFDFDNLNTTEQPNTNKNQFIDKFWMGLKNNPLLITYGLLIGFGAFILCCCGACCLVNYIKKRNRKIAMQLVKTINDNKNNADQENESEDIEITDDNEDDESLGRNINDADNDTEDSDAIIACVNQTIRYME